MKEDLLKKFEEWKKEGRNPLSDDARLFKGLLSLSEEVHPVKSEFRSEVLRKVKDISDRKTIWRLIMRLIGNALSEGANALLGSRLRLAGSVIGACAALLVVISLGTENIPTKNRTLSRTLTKVKQDAAVSPTEESLTSAVAPVVKDEKDVVERFRRDVAKLNEEQELAGAAVDSAIAPKSSAPAYKVAEQPIMSPPFIGGGRMEAERYGSYAPQPRIDVGTEAFSTFAVDVDTASYTNFRRFIRMRMAPPPDAVRVEEFVNYFSYNYPKPKEDVFGVLTEISPAPFSQHRHIVRIGLSTKDAPDLGDKPWNLVFLVDVSGSMNDPQKLPLVKAALTLLAEKMRANDKIAIVTYAGSSGVALPSTAGSNREAILSAIGGLGAGGSTNGEGGIRLAYEIASQNLISSSVNRVVLATDGDFNVGVTNHDELLKIIREKRTSGITLTTLGFGSGNINDELMEQLANKGDGNYFYVDSMAEAKKVLGEGLLKNLDLLARDVKIQVEFNPQVVSEYRLIGFDNRKLNKEDFRDDSKDGGEVGPGHQVTALYEVLLKENKDKLNVESRYQPTPAASIQSDGGSHSNELGAVRIRYKSAEGGEAREQLTPVVREIKGSFERATPDHRFAVGVATLAEILRKSGFESTATLKDVRAILDGARADDPKSERRELVELVDELMVIR